jgi:uncharacterized membrane protein YagU involved in acid resistance
VKRSDPGEIKAAERLIRQSAKRPSCASKFHQKGTELKARTIQLVLIGAVAGLGATVPMTVAIEALFRLLPKRERYPLPPRQIAVTLAEDVGVKKHLNEPARTTLTLAAHFGYGAGTGSIYAPLARNNDWPPTISGACFGLTVWGASYLGLLPMLGILRPATAHAAGRNILMITAHIVWGATLGLLVNAIDRSAQNGRHQASDNDSSE